MYVFKFFALTIMSALVWDRTGTAILNVIVEVRSCQIKELKVIEIDRVLYNRNARTFRRAGGGE